MRGPGNSAEPARLRICPLPLELASVLDRRPAPRPPCRHPEMSTLRRWNNHLRYPLGFGHLLSFPCYRSATRWPPSRDWHIFGASGRLPVSITRPCVIRMSRSHGWDVTKRCRLLFDRHLVSAVIETIQC